jgi:5-(carboxyamino)imidazole ribonucleotide mutase
MTALVGIIMGSTSDWETMRFTAETLERLGIPHQVEVVSAHRTPDKLFLYAETAEAKGGSDYSGCWWCCTFTWYDCR